MCPCLTFLQEEPQPGQELCFKQASFSNGGEPPSTLTVFYALDALLRAFCALASSILVTTQGVGCFIVSVLKMWNSDSQKLRDLLKVTNLLSVRARIWTRVSPVLELRVTHLSRLVWDCPSFSATGPKSQKTPSCLDNAGWPVIRGQEAMRVTWYYQLWVSFKNCISSFLPFPVSSIAGEEVIFIFFGIRLKNGWKLIMPGFGESCFLLLNFCIRDDLGLLGLQITPRIFSSSSLAVFQLWSCFHRSPPMSWQHWVHLMGSSHVIYM